jgi:hypothetical protein
MRPLSDPFKRPTKGKICFGARSSDLAECFKRNVTRSWWMFWYRGHAARKTTEWVLTCDELPNIMGYLKGTPGVSQPAGGQ